MDGWMDRIIVHRYSIQWRLFIISSCIIPPTGAQSEQLLLVRPFVHFDPAGEDTSLYDLSIYLCMYLSIYLSISHIPLLYQRSVGSSSSSNNNSVLPPSMSDALGKGKSASTGTVYVPCTPDGRNLTSVLSIVRTVGTMCPAIALCGKE